MSHLPLPRWAYVPGEAYEADADCETLASPMPICGCAWRSRRRRGCLSRRSPSCARRATGSGDGFADGFPVEALSATLKGRLERPALTKADWVPMSPVSRA